MKVASLVLLAGLAAGIIVTAASGQQPDAPSVLTGAYTEEQAIRGQTLYNERCWQCHGEALAGLDQAPALTGPQFGSVWQGEPLWALVGRIDTMPPDQPRSLSRQEIVDLLSYILWYNGLPAGENPLAVDQGTLTKIQFDSPVLSRR